MNQNLQKQRQPNQCLQEQRKPNQRHQPTSAASRRRAARLWFLLTGCLSDDPWAAVREIEAGGLWEYVASKACDTRLGGLLLHALDEHQINPPASTVAQLEAYREHLIAANRYNRASVQEVFVRLTQAGLPFLLLKGAALNAMVYDQPGMRGMVDIDVLIRPRDAERADHLLRQCGCSRGPDLVQNDFYPRYYYEREYITRHKPPVKIDLHVRPFRPLRYIRTIPDDAMWDETQEVSFGNIRVNIPSPENMLIHLCGHAACHGLMELRWLYDIKRWLDRCGPRIDPNQVVSKCRAWQVELPINSALEQTRSVFSHLNPVSTKIVTRLAQPIRPLDWLALRQAPHDAQHPVTATLVNALCTPGLRFRLGYLKAVLIPSAAHMRQLYDRQHHGWLLVAHALRAVRTITRPFTPAPATT